MRGVWLFGEVESAYFLGIDHVSLFKKLFFGLSY